MDIVRYAALRARPIPDGNSERSGYLRLGELQKRLVDLARSRVRDGRVTERGLAKLCGISQPNLHNVLKNIRMLSNESADRLMEGLHVTVADLLWSTSGEQEVDVRAVPLLRSRLGPGADAVLTVHRGVIPLPAYLIEGLVNPLAAVVAPDLDLPRLVAANDVVLLDQNPAVRGSAEGLGVWVVAEGGGLRIRYLRTKRFFLYVLNQRSTLAVPDEWQPVSLVQQSILEIVRARVVWIGREFKDDHFGYGVVTVAEGLWENEAVRRGEVAEWSNAAVSKTDLAALAKPL